MEAGFIKKTVEVNRRFLENAKDALQTKTDKETVNRALEIVSEEQGIIEAHMEVGGAGEIENVFQ